jgi:hypothetical protein
METFFHQVHLAHAHIGGLWRYTMTTLPLIFEHLDFFVVSMFFGDF